jgi:hypothetical protein
MESTGFAREPYFTKSSGLARESYFVNVSLTFIKNSSSLCFDSLDLVTTKKTSEPPRM